MGTPNFVSLLEKTRHMILYPRVRGKYSILWSLTLFMLFCIQSASAKDRRHNSKARHPQRCQRLQCRWFKLGLLSPHSSTSIIQDMQLKVIWLMNNPKRTQTIIKIILMRIVHLINVNISKQATTKNHWKHKNVVLLMNAVNTLPPQWPI